MILQGILGPALVDWADTSGDFNVARVVLLSPWDYWAMAAVAVCALAVLGLAWRNVRQLPARRRAFLVVMRALAVLTLLLLFLQPGVRLEHVSRVRNHVVMLIDGSRSMDLPAQIDADDGSRLERTLEALSGQADTLAAWQQQHQIDWFEVSDRARPRGAPHQIEARGDTTHLQTALDDIAARFQPGDLASVILFSDGADNGALGDALASGSREIPPLLAETAARVGVPIHTVFSGPDRPPPDIAIAEVAYDEFAFVRNAVSIEAEITVTGYEDLSVPVVLRRGDTVLGTRALQIRQGTRRYPFEFEFVPDKTGKPVFTLEVGTGPGERITVNNRRQFVIRIIRDKIRVLQVVGRPSWDQRFLRKLLKKNPNVDLISFFILRTGTNLMLASQNEMSLIPFPTRELFEVQLGSFDLIVFQNFTYRGYHMSGYLPLIRDFVADGGGFVMIGGDQSFSSGGYAGTAVAEFLPVRLPHEHSGLIRTDRFKARLTEAGARHPITALSLIPEDNAELWSGLPTLSGTNRVLAPKTGALTLLEHPKERVDQTPAPVVVAGAFGEGRVLAVATDSTWSWAFRTAADGGDSRHYYKFWGNAIRWLIKDPDLQAVRVEADRDRYPLNAEVTVMARVVDREYNPASDVETEVTVEREWYAPGGQRQVTTALKSGGRTTDLGERVWQFTPEQDGAYRVRARALLPGGEATAEDMFVVAADPVELRHTEPRRDTLEIIAAAGGGRVLDLDNDLDELAALPRVQPRVVKVNRRRDVALWSSGWWLLIAVLFPSVEWFFRRRWSLL